MQDITLVNHLNSMAGPQGTTTDSKASSADGNFVRAMMDAVNRTDQALIEADQAVEKLNTGEAKSLHEVMISMEKADISMRLLVQMRNKMLEAYKEIMRLSM